MSDERNDGAESNSPNDVGANGGSLSGGTDGRGSLTTDGSSGSRGFGAGTADGDEGLLDTIAGSGLGRPDPMAGVEAHRDDVPEDGGSPGMSGEIRPSGYEPGAGDPGSLSGSAASSQGGGPTPTTQGE